MTVKRESIFISHATPEDNDFTIWIASRLEMAGYKVWIDKNELIGGERFWAEIDNQIRNHSVKVLLVYSDNICKNKKPGELKDGIYDELELAKSVSRKNEFKDFIIPLKIDNSSYDLFVGANSLNHISFFENWAIGLDLLLKKLEKDEIPKVNQEKDSSIIDWFEHEFTQSDGIIERNEVYYSSWWSFNYVPENFYMFIFDNLKQAKSVFLANRDIPIGKRSNVLTSFEKNLNLNIETQHDIINITPKETIEFKIKDVLFTYESNEFPTHRDLQNHFKTLLNRVFHLLLKNKGLSWHLMSSKSNAYYFQKDLLFKNQVKFNFPNKSDGKKKRKSLLGKHKDLTWHYAVSSKPLLEPYLGFSLKHHLIFTQDGKTPLDDKKTMHSNRRSKGKRFFNEEWRDLQIAFVQSLKDNSEVIQIGVCEKDFVIMENYPEIFISDFGYIDPTNKMEIQDDDDEYN